MKSAIRVIIGVAKFLWHTRPIADSKTHYVMAYRVKLPNGEYDIKVVPYCIKKSAKGNSQPNIKP